MSARWSPSFKTEGRLALVFVRLLGGRSNHVQQGPRDLQVGGRGPLIRLMHRGGGQVGLGALRFLRRRRDQRTDHLLLQGSKRFRIQGAVAVIEMGSERANQLVYYLAEAPTQCCELIVIEEEGKVYAFPSWDSPIGYTLKF